MDMKAARRRNSIMPFFARYRFKIFFAMILFCSAFHQWTIYGDSRIAVLVKTGETRFSSTPQQALWNVTNSLQAVRETQSRRVIWSQARGDRSGAFIQDMLMCHAYAYHNNMVYGGVCARDTSRKYKSKHQELLNSIGLSKFLGYACPPDDDTPLQDRMDYIKDDTGIFTPQYLDYLQKLVEYPPKSRRRRIAVHIRRGDISPCRPRTRGYPRYLPNQHFLRLIDRYNPQNNSDVFIYSESDSYENFGEFRNRGYKVVLDGSIGKVWKGILKSDVIILSRSSFSLVPAIMTKGKVVFTPFWHQPLPNWDVVEETFVNESLMEFRRLKATCPNKNKKNKKNQS